MQESARVLSTSLNSLQLTSTESQKDTESNYLQDFTFNRKNLTRTAWMTSQGFDGLTMTTVAKTYWSYSPPCCHSIMFRASYPMHEAFHTASSPSSVGKFLSCYALCISTTGDRKGTMEGCRIYHSKTLGRFVSTGCLLCMARIFSMGASLKWTSIARAPSKNFFTTSKPYLKNMSIYMHKFPATFLSRVPRHATPARPPKSLNKENTLKWRIILNGSGQHPVLQPSRCKERGTTPTALQTENLPPEWQLGGWRRISSDHVWPGFMYRGMAWNMLVAIKMWDKHPPDS